MRMVRNRRIEASRCPWGRCRDNSFEGYDYDDQQLQRFPTWYPVYQNHLSISEKLVDLDLIQIILTFEEFSLNSSFRNG
jgi:hypothetical protein